MSLWPDDVNIILPGLQDHSLEGIYILFPDPWFKKRHHKRRLITTDRMKTCIQKLNIGGIIYLASDIQEYVEEIHKIFSDLANVKQIKSENGAVHSGYSMTKYHKKAIQNSDAEIHFLQFQKVH